MEVIYHNLRLVFRSSSSILWWFFSFCFRICSQHVVFRSASGGSTEQVFPVTKMAELKKLRTGGNSIDRHVLGTEITSVGVRQSSRVVINLIYCGGC